MKEVRLFFVVDSNELNEEIFETLDGAKGYAKAQDDPTIRLRVCLVRNAYRESNGAWNYDDYSDTFETLKVLKI